MVDCKSRFPISDMKNLSLQTHRSALCPSWLCLFDYKHNKTKHHYESTTCTCTSFPTTHTPVCVCDCIYYYFEVLRSIIFLRLQGDLCVCIIFTYSYARMYCVSFKVLRIRQYTNSCKTAHRP